MAPHLEVSGPDLSKALAHIAKATTRGGKPVKGSIGFRDGMVRIGAGNITGKAPATGQWDGEARVSGDFILGIAHVPPPLDGAVTLTVEAGQLHVQSGDRDLTASCAWEKAKPPLVAVSNELTLLEKYALSISLSEEQQEEARLKTQVQEGRRIVERKIREAAVMLAGLGIEEDTLRELVRQRALEGKK